MNIIKNLQLDKDREVKRPKNRKLDYNKKKFDNPFFKETSKKICFSKLSFRKKLIVIEVIIVLLCAIYFFLFSGYYSINEIHITGLERLSTDSMKNEVWHKLRDKTFIFNPSTNLLFLKEDKLYKHLDENYSFDSIIITKEYPKKISIDLKERTSAFIWCEENRYYYTDSKGFIINEIGPLEIDKNFPLIVNESKKCAIDNKIQLEEEYVAYVFDLFDRLRNNKEIEIDRFLIDQDIDTVKMILTKGPKIYFNIQKDVDEQIKKVLIIKNEKLKNNFYTKEYIDLRYGEKIYYR